MHHEYCEYASSSLCDGCDTATFRSMRMAAICSLLLLLHQQQHAWNLLAKRPVTTQTPITAKRENSRPTGGITGASKQPGCRNHVSSCDCTMLYSGAGMQSTIHGIAHTINPRQLSREQAIMTCDHLLLAENPSLGQYVLKTIQCSHVTGWRSKRRLRPFAEETR